MSKRLILVADDIENKTDSGKRRSHAIVSAASVLAQRLGTIIALLFVEDSKAHPTGSLDSMSIREWHTRHEEWLDEMSKQFPTPASCSEKRPAGRADLKDLAVQVSPGARDRGYARKERTEASSCRKRSRRSDSPFQTASDGHRTNGSGKDPSSDGSQTVENFSSNRSW